MKLGEYRRQLHLTWRIHPMTSVSVLGKALLIVPDHAGLFGKGPTEIQLPNALDIGVTIAIATITGPPLNGFVT